ncbi:hypothetical protein Tco_0398389 [Tanacetum coccineum]
MAGSVWKCPGQAGLVGVWPVLAGYGWVLWPGVAESWQVMVGTGGSWLVMAGSGSLWSGLADYDRPGLGQARSWPGQVLARPGLGQTKMWRTPPKPIKMTLEVGYPAVDKIKTESTVIQVEAKCLIKRGTPSSRSSRSGDHHRSRRDSPEYDRRDGRVMAMYLDTEAPQSSLVSLQLDSFLYSRLFQYSQCSNVRENDAELML